MQRRQPAAADPQAPRHGVEDADAAAGEGAGSELEVDPAADIAPSAAAHESRLAPDPSDAEHGSSPPQSRQQAGDAAAFGAQITAAALRGLQSMRTWRLWTPHERQQRRDQASRFASDAA